MGKRRRARRRQFARRAALVMTVLAVSAAAVSIVLAMRLQSQLRGARDAMLSGRAALVAGDPETARTEFARAEAAFRMGEVTTHNPLLRAVGLLPLLGRTPDVAVALAQAGQRTAAAGQVVSDALEEVPGGLAALAPRRGRIPIARLQRLAPPLAEASGLLNEASARIAATPSTWLLGPVADARREFGPLVDEAARTARAAATLARALPPFLGSDGPRTYLLGAQSPAELRGTGGLIGSYAILEAADGRLDIGPFRPTQELGRVPVDEVAPPSEDYAEIYDRFGSRGFWANVNMTPDFPTAATALETLYRASTGESVDGTIVVDPFALEALLQVGGPVRVPSLGVTLTPQNAVEYVANRAYGQLGSEERKRVLGEAARRVLERYLAGSGGTAETAGGPGEGEFGSALTLAAEAVVEAAGEGHILLHSTEPTVQGAFEQVGVAGSFGTGRGDFLGVVANNAAGNKADFYLDRSVTYAVELADDGAASARATVSLTNRAPTEGLPAYVIGPYDERFEPGENRALVSTYCATTCQVQSLTEEGRPTDVIARDLSEKGHPLLATLVRMFSGELARLEYSWVVQDAWSEEEGTGVYHLTYEGQPTIRPTRLRVEVTAPPGTHVMSVTEGMQVEGRRAIYEGTADDEASLEVRFGWSLLTRIARFFNRPVIELGAVPAS